MSVDVQHRPESSRFEVAGGDVPAVLTYTRGEGSVEFLHTVVPADLEGQGVGGALAAAGVGWAREQGLDVVPTCSFVARWVERHPA